MIADLPPELPDHHAVDPAAYQVYASEEVMRRLGWVGQMLQKISEENNINYILVSRDDLIPPDTLADPAIFDDVENVEAYYTPEALQSMLQMHFNSLALPQDFTYTEVDWTQSAIPAAILTQDPMVLSFDLNDDSKNDWAVITLPDLNKLPESYFAYVANLPSKGLQEVVDDQMSWLAGDIFHEACHPFLHWSITEEILVHEVHADACMAYTFNEAAKEGFAVNDRIISQNYDARLISSLGSTGILEMTTSMFSGNVHGTHANLFPTHSTEPFKYTTEPGLNLEDTSRATQERLSISMLVNTVANIALGLVKYNEFLAENANGEVNLIGDASLFYESKGDLFTGLDGPNVINDIGLHYNFGNPLQVIAIWDVIDERALPDDAQVGMVADYLDEVRAMLGKYLPDYKVTDEYQNAYALTASFLPDRIKTEHLYLSDGEKYPAAASGIAFNPSNPVGP